MKDEHNSQSMEEGASLYICLALINYIFASFGNQCYSRNAKRFFLRTLFTMFLLRLYEEDRNKILAFKVRN